jgi:hypothetical protein
MGAQGGAFSTRGERERYELTLALLTTIERGMLPHCADHSTRHLWTSEDPGDRALASEMCGGCPVLRPCFVAAAKSGATHSVYGGHHFTTGVRQEAG